MELRQLRYFVAVADEGNISRAARKIFLTQPALSRQIKSLEEEIGQCLLERQAHSIQLTPAGESLLTEARDLLQHADQVLDRVREAGRGVRLRVGYAPSLAAGLLSTAVLNFTQAHPNARIELLDLATDEMLAGLENDKLDVVVTVAQRREASGLRWVPLARARCYPVGGPDTPPRRLNATGHGLTFGAAIPQDVAFVQSSAGVPDGRAIPAVRGSSSASRTTWPSATGSAT